MAITARPGGSGTLRLKSFFMTKKEGWPVLSFEISEQRNCGNRHMKILLPDFQSDTHQATGLGGGDRRARAHEWIQNSPLGERQRCTHYLPQKVLRLERRMRS